MSAIALVVSVTALAMAGVAYWRSGGQRDVHRFDDQLRRDIDGLRAKHAELVDHTTESLAAAYQHSRNRLQGARNRLHGLQESAAEGLDAQLRRAGEQIDALAQRLEQAAVTAKSATVAAARATERGIATRVRRAQAQVMLLEVKAKAALAQRAAADGAFDRADARLTEATDLLSEERAIVPDDIAYLQGLDAIRDTLRQAVLAVRSQAQDTRRRIDQVLVDTDRVVTTLESDERQAGPEAQSSHGETTLTSAQR